MMQVSYTLSNEYPEVAFLSMKGSVDSSALQDLAENLSSLYDVGRPYVIVDLSETESITGSVIGELIEWRRDFITGFDGNFCFAAAPAAIERTIRDIDFDKIFRIFPDRRSAINYFFWEYKGQIDTIILTIPSTLTIVPATRKFVRRTCESKGYSGREAFQIETIVDELCNNAIEHGIRDSAKNVELAIAVGRKKVDINISNGIEVEHRDYNDVVKNMERYVDSPSTSAADMRGRGLALVKMLSSDFEIDGSENGTCVHVTKVREEK
ncbi:MAG: ATP-binding protein [Fibrobacterota bacterium]